MTKEKIRRPGNPVSRLPPKKRDPKWNWRRQQSEPYPLKQFDHFGRPEDAHFMISRITTRWPVVRISGIAQQKMWALVQECDLEIGWLCTVSRDRSGNFLVEDVYVPEQTCTMSTTDISADGVGALLGDLLGNGQIDEVRKLKCWGHSHVKMTVFASAVDLEQTKDYLEQHDDFFVRIIANKYGHLYCTAFLIDEDIQLEHVPLELESISDLDFTDWARNEIASKVRRQVMTRVYCKDYGLAYSDDRFTPDELDELIEEGHIDESFRDWYLSEGEKRSQQKELSYESDQ